MADNKLKLGLENQDNSPEQRFASAVIEKNDAVIEGAVSEIAEKVDVLGENDENGGFKEEAKGVKDYSLKTGGQSSGNASVANAKGLPTIENMIKQTVVAVELQLKIEEEQIKVLIKNKKATPYQINEQAKKIRILNGILGKLKNVAKLAEDFVIGLWKQYARKTS
ncbi:hypothetical protein IT412_04420 [Candidatus Peregrinibacteria bacterium]|nr:hypothetical protein [Candidatus Peregrinibacteria bacterium]